MTRAELEDMKNNENRNIKRKKEGSDSEDENKTTKDDDMVSKKRKLDLTKKQKDEIMADYKCVDIKG